MGTTQTATLRMLLQDDVSAAAGKVAASMKGVTGAEAKLVQESERLGLASKKLEQFDRVRQTFAASRTAFNEAKANVEKLARAMGATDAPSTKMRKELERAREQASKTASAFDKQKTKLVATKRAYEELTGGPLRNVATAQADIRRRTDETTAAIKRQAAAALDAAEKEAAAAKAQAKAAGDARRAHTGGGRRSGHGGDTSTVGGLLSLGIAHEFEEGARKAVEQYREFDKERRYAGAVMNLNFDQQKELVQQAIRGGGTSKFNDIQWLESQRELAARGYAKEQVLGFTPVVADIATALDKTMPEAVKLLEGSMLGFGKDVSTFDKAVAAARRTADLQVKASKISGMNAEDIQSLYKYAASSARMAGLSEENMLAYGAISKKSNLGGDEAGVAFRALVKNLLTPTGEARTAMMASGLDFSRYQAAPKEMDTTGFVLEVARKFGVQLEHGTIMQLKGLFADKAVMADPSAFMPAVTQLLRGSLGGNDAKSLKSIAGLAGRYRDASAGQVDVNALMSDLMVKIAQNPSLANVIFGSKAGGKIFAALGDPDFFRKILGELQNESQGYARDVAGKRMAGFDGALSMLQGSMLNLEGAFGRAFDNDGKGGFLTDVTRGAAGLTQALAEADPAVLRMAGTAAAGVAALAGLKGLGWIKGGFGLQRSATHLDESAIALKEAAAAQRGAHGGGSPGAPSGGSKPGESAKPEPQKTGPGEQPKSGFFGSGAKNFLLPFLGELGIQSFAYEEGREAIDLFTHHVLGFDEKSDEKYDKVMGGLSATKTVGGIYNYFFPEGPADDPYLGPDRARINHRALQAARAFIEDPEAARGRAMMAMNGASPTASAQPLAALLPQPEATPVEPDDQDDDAEPTGYARGGYTGHGRMDEIAGVVHGREFVVNARSTAGNLPLLHAINEGRFEMARLALGSAHAGGVGTDGSTARRHMIEAVTEGTYRGMERLLGTVGEGGLFGGGGYGGDAAGNPGAPNLRYGRRTGGGYRGTPGADGDAGAFNARQPDKPGMYRPVYSLGDADLSDDVVGTVAGEARTSNAEGVDAVINNMLNRVGSKGWGPSANLQQVAMAPGQYAGHRRASAKEAKFIRSRIRAIASGGVPDNTHGSNAYRADWYRGPWYQRHAGSAVDIGGNNFAYESSTPNGPYAPYKEPHGAPAPAAAAPDTPPSMGAHLADLKRSGLLTDEQCVTLAMASVGIRKGSGALGSNVHDWRRGVGAAEGTLTPGTPVATFLNRDGTPNARGLYAGGGAGTPGAHLDHAGVFESYLRDQAGKIVGMKLLEQYQGSHGQHLKDYFFRHGWGEGNASNYAAVMVRGDGALGGSIAQADVEARRRALLPQPTPSAAPERHAAGIDFDHSGIDAAIAKVDTLDAKLRGLRSTASVDINHTHTHRSEAGPVSQPGAVRTSLNGRFGSDGRTWG